MKTEDLTKDPIVTVDEHGKNWFKYTDAEALNADSVNEREIASNNELYKLWDEIDFSPLYNKVLTSKKKLSFNGRENSLLYKHTLPKEFFRGILHQVAQELHIARSAKDRRNGIAGKKSIKHMAVVTGIITDYLRPFKGRGVTKAKDPASVAMIKLAKDLFGDDLNGQLKIVTGALNAPNTSDADKEIIREYIKTLNSQLNK